MGNGDNRATQKMVRRKAQNKKKDREKAKIPDNKVKQEEHTARTVTKKVTKKKSTAKKVTTK